MSAGSTSAQAIHDEADAAAALRGRDDEGLQFASVRHAVAFAFERAPSMQCALTHHPRGHQARDGSTVVLRVDGGRGGSIDDVLSTLQTVHDALAALRRRDPCAHDVLVLNVKWGLSFTEIEDLAIDREAALVRYGARARYIAADITTALPRDAGTVSACAHVATAFLLGLLQGHVVRGSARGIDDREALRQTFTEAWVVRALQDRGATLREVERMVRSPALAPEDLREAVKFLPRDSAALSRLSRVAEAYLVARAGRR